MPMYFPYNFVYAYAEINEAGTIPGSVVLVINISKFAIT